MAYRTSQLTHSPLALSSLGLLFGAWVASACSPLAPSMRKTEGRYEAHSLQGESNPGETSAPLSQPTESPQEIKPAEKRTLIPLQLEENAMELLSQGETLCLTLSHSEEGDLTPDDNGVLDLIVGVPNSEQWETLGELEFKRVTAGECTGDSPKATERYFEVTSKNLLTEFQNAPEQTFFIHLKGAETVTSSL